MKSEIHHRDHGESGVAPVDCGSRAEPTVRPVREAKAYWANNLEVQWGAGQDDPQIHNAGLRWARS